MTPELSEGCRIILRGIKIRIIPILAIQPLAKMETPEEQNQKKETRDINWNWLIIPLIIAVLGWIANWYMMIHYFDEPGDRGLAGDMFGATTSLFSGLAFAVLIFTMYMQRIELGYQRKELELTRKEFKKQTKAMQETLKYNRMALLSENQPFFKYESSTLTGNKRYDSLLDIINIGNPAYGKPSVVCNNEHWEPHILRNEQVIKSGQKVRIYFIKKSENKTLDVHLMYRDKLGNVYSQSLKGPQDFSNVVISNPEIVGVSHRPDPYEESES